MIEALSPAEFEQRVTHVSRHLESLRGAARPGGHGSSLPYAGIDLTAELPELAPVLYGLVHQDPDEPLTTNPRTEVAARRLALAAIMTLISGGRGLADFSARYEALMGAAPEYALFERVLPNALREAGLPLPLKLDAKHLLGALLAAGELPGGLLKAVAEYFVIYWRDYHPQPAPLAALETASRAEGASAELLGLAELLLPNVAVVGPAVEGLASVMTFLRTQSNRRVTDLFSHADAIEAGCGVNPRALLRDSAEALAVLTEHLDRAWHPEQFRHVLTSFPRGGEVRLPSGALTLVEKAAAIAQYGLYRVEGKAYMVLPNEALTLDDVRAAAPGALSVAGNRVIWKGDAEAEVFADGWPQLQGPRPVFDERAPLGHFYFHLPPKARSLRVGDQTLPPLPGLHWRVSFLATVEGGTPVLNARLSAVRASFPELAGHTLQVECPQAETAGRLTFDLDERGAGGLPEQLLAIREPQAGVFELFLQDHATAEVVEWAGKPAIQRVAVPEVLLFSEATGAPVLPSASPYPYGLPSYLLFTTRPLNTETLELMEVGVETLGQVGGFSVHRLSWNQPHQSLSIQLGGQFHWTFDQRVETVWHAGELPPPPAPLAFAPETPVGFTVATADDLFVDDISLVENPLVIVARDGEVLAAHTWEELNWLMSFPTENRRFSGVMLRRVLHAAPEFDLAGRYTLALKAGGEVLGERQVVILPQLAITVSPTGPQLEETSYTLTATCPLPAFAGGETSYTLALGSPLVDREVMENSPFQPKPLAAHLPLRMPLYDVPVVVVPEIAGFRLLDDNEGTWIRKTNLTYEELGHITLVLFGTDAQTGTLVVGDGEAITEEFYEGFATFSLAEIQETLRSHETELNVAVDGRPVGTLTVLWHPKVLQFETSNDYLVEQAAQLEMHVVGPEDAPVRLEALSPDGRKLGTLEVHAGDGEPQRVSFHLPASRDYPVITVQAVVSTESSGIASGTLEVRNAAFEPEIEEMNRRIASEPHSGELRHARAQLLLQRGLRKAAARDFQAAIELGMTEILDSPQYQQFLNERQAESFHEDIKALASFFVPFAQKELSIG